MTQPTPNTPAIPNETTPVTLTPVSPDVTTLAGTSRTAQALAMVAPASGLANELARTNFVPSALRGKPAEILACILTGDELDLPPMTALKSVHVIEGRPSLSAEVMRALVTRAGHLVWFEEVSSRSVTICARRREWDSPDWAGPIMVNATVTWTTEDAQRAGLLKRDNWRKYPRAMLKARATGEIMRDLFGDVLAGIGLTREEAVDGLDWDDLPAEPDAAEIESGEERPEGAPAPPKKATAKKKRAPAKKKAAKKAPAKKAPAKAPAVAPPPPLPGDPPAEAATEPQEAPDPTPGPDTPPDGSEPQEPPESSEPEASEMTEDGIEPLPDPPAAQSTEVRRAQMLAIRCGELGMDDDERHRLIGWATEGRTFSGKEVTSEETDYILSTLELLEAGTHVFAEWRGEWSVFPAGGVPDEPESEPDAAGEDDGSGEEAPPDIDGLVLPEDAAEWRAFLKEREVRIPDVIREAQRVAEGLEGREAPTSLEDLAADDELAGLMLSWVEARLAEGRE